MGGKKGKRKTKAMAKMALPRAHPRPKGEHATWMYYDDAQAADEVSFREGDIVTVLQKDPSGWWEIMLANGTKGWCPGSWCQINA